jgi:hypothetical protein
MARLTTLGLGACALCAALALTAAQRPSALGGTSGGLWEITGAPGAKAPVRECVADVATLAQFEHRGHSCSSNVLVDKASSTVIEYSCAAAGFGRTEINVLTPRSLRISTQGISDNLPFSYVLEARRVGDCPKAVTATRH